MKKINRPNIKKVQPKVSSENLVENGLKKEEKSHPLMETVVKFSITKVGYDLDTVEEVEEDEEDGNDSEKEDSDSEKKYEKRRSLNLSIRKESPNKSVITIKKTQTEKNYDLERSISEKFKNVKFTKKSATLVPKKKSFSRLFPLRNKLDKANTFNVSSSTKLKDEGRTLFASDILKPYSRENQKNGSNNSSLESSQNFPTKNSNLLNKDSNQNLGRDSQAMNNDSTQSLNKNSGQILNRNSNELISLSTVLKLKRDIEKSGWLYKKESGVNPWKKRWFVLSTKNNGKNLFKKFFLKNLKIKNEKILEITFSKDKNFPPIGRINLTDAVVNPLKLPKKDFCFSVESKSYGKTLICDAESAQERDVWTESLLKITGGSNSKKIQNTSSIEGVFQTITDSLLKLFLEDLKDPKKEKILNELSEVCEIISLSGIFLSFVDKFQELLLSPNLSKGVLSSLLSFLSRICFTDKKFRFSFSNNSGVISNLISLLDGQFSELVSLLLLEFCVENGKS